LRLAPNFVPVTLLQILLRLDYSVFYCLSATADITVVAMEIASAGIANGARELALPNPHPLAGRGHGRQQGNFSRVGKLGLQRQKFPREV